MILGVMQQKKNTSISDYHGAPINRVSKVLATGVVVHNFSQEALHTEVISRCTLDTTILGNKGIIPQTTQFQ